MLVTIFAFINVTGNILVNNLLQNPKNLNYFEKKLNCLNFANMCGEVCGRLN